MYPTKQSSAMECLREELAKVQQAQSECVTDCGTVKSNMRYRYNLLVKQANELKNSLDWFVALYDGK